MNASESDKHLLGPPRRVFDNLNLARTWSCSTSTLYLEPVVTCNSLPRCSANCIALASRGMLSARRAVSGSESCTMRRSLRGGGYCRLQY